MVRMVAMRKADDLALYYYDGCPYCDRVRDALERLGVEVELRDVHRDRANMDALVAERGRRTVPVLRIRGESGADRWMPESADIVAYLAQRFG